MKINLIIDSSLEEDEVQVHAQNATVGARVLSYVDHFTKDKENITVKSDDKFTVIKKMDIVCAEIHNKVLTIYTSKESVQTYKSLSTFLDELNSNTFMQVSKSELLNIQMIKKVEPSFSGNLIAVMSNGQKVNISRRFVSILKERLGI
ncbi:LytTR family DNA-binding domain-containing protein [Nosocomiicoccus massiliensis]|uniref:LytTR family DNA-binding domain-containing protein n=1 Tax=Nosocomiicoccus massiliensis TaxID=1232430 RepID=UPI0003FAE9AD|nr:LytTR family DNA-binding domain-containing protein [Nosocomiicoccus massiliensis]